MLMGYVLQQDKPASGLHVGAVASSSGRRWMIMTDIPAHDIRYGSFSVSGRKSMKRRLPASISSLWSVAELSQWRMLWFLIPGLTGPFMHLLQDPDELVAVG